MKIQSKRKKVSLFLAGIGLLLIIFKSVEITLASFKSNESEENNFRVADLAVGIEEEFDKPTVINPNDTVTKKVSIKNRSEAPVFLRVLVLPQIRSKADDAGYQLLLPANIGEEILVDLNSTDWKYGEDGYYYYLSALPSNQETEKLFTSVSIQSGLPNEYIDAEMVIEIKVESINTTKWSYQDAWWNGDSTQWSSGALFDIDNILKHLVTN